jgi:UDP-N-acetylglucosamine 2-epimerase (non-hydrolysing)
MQEGQSLYDVVRNCLGGLRGVLADYRPDLVVAEGDTASVFVTGLVSFFERTRLAHVEAGLRSGDKWRPWPEEIFRKLTGVVADLHFAPTPAARRNLLAEGIPGAAVFVTGNTVVDALMWAAARPQEPRDPELRAALDGGRRTAASPSASPCATRWAPCARWPTGSLTSRCSTRSTPIPTSARPRSRS